MLPWGQLLRVAQCEFGLMPAAFWVLSVLEWRSLQNPHAGHADQADLEELMASYPDIPTQVRDHEYTRNIAQ